MNKTTFKQLNPEQQFWYANVMIDMVLADGKIHPSEQKYLGLIFSSFAEQSTELNQLKEKAQRVESGKPAPISGISHKLSLSILQDCVDAAISDAEFHENEQALIYEIGKALKCTASEVGEVITRGKHLLGHIFAFAS